MRTRESTARQKQNAAASADSNSDPLLRVDCHLDPAGDALVHDARRGLSRTPKMLPPKYFYDEYGSRLFDRICDLPEYYLTRCEYALLREAAAEVIDRTRPTHLVELGSGSARKTRVLLDAMTGASGRWYVPIDVGESMLRETAGALRREYPDLGVHAIVADYERHLERIPAGPRRLVTFLGSTIGNFTRPAAAEFVRRLADALRPGDFVLIGMDLVKPREILNAAYNDTAGLTAEFNRNVLRVLNRELRANFDLERFEHVAFFNESESQVEMHLRAREAHAVALSRLGMRISFARGEMMLTEISRKFTHEEAGHLFERAGLRLARWYATPERWFALALGELAR